MTNTRPPAVQRCMPGVSSGQQANARDAKPVRDRREIGLRRCVVNKLSSLFLLAAGEPRGWATTFRYEWKAEWIFGVVMAHCDAEESLWGLSEFCDMTFF